MTITIQSGPDDSLFHVVATGKLSQTDYEEWVPKVDALIAKQGRVGILFEMHEFHGWTAGALWADLKFGIQHFTKIDRIAIVGETAWQKGMAMFCKPFTMARIRYFDAHDVDAAKQWLHHHDGAGDKPTFDLSSAGPKTGEWLAVLDSQDGVARERARTELVKMGAEAVDDLVRAAQGGSAQLRLEATKALSTLADPALATVLAAQFDDSAEIGWAAAEGLKQLGRDGAVAALQQLVQHPNSLGVRMSTHHALREMQAPDIRATVAGVASALVGDEPIAAVRVAADTAMTALASA